jgi:DSF synthase
MDRFHENAVQDIRLENIVKDVQFEHLKLDFDPANQAVWMEFNYPGRPCMSPDLLRDFGRAQQEIATIARQGYESGDPSRLRYMVLSSGLPGVFSLGGDLDYFIRLIRAGDKASLSAYAKACIDILYANISGYGLPFTSIALVQGETLGGGFEAALSANILVAERSARFGFPETVFGMFPGMGAYSFLSRRLNPALAKRMITSGKTYSSEELYEMGVVDHLAEDGRGREMVYNVMNHQKGRIMGFDGLDRVIRQTNPIYYEELIDVVNIWVDTGMELTEKNLRLMEHLVRAQEQRWVHSRQPESDPQKPFPRLVVG